MNNRNARIMNLQHKAWCTINSDPLIEGNITAVCINLAFFPDLLLLFSSARGSSRPRSVARAFGVQSHRFWQITTGPTPTC